MDFVQRLRETAKKSLREKILFEAADEIERLREAIKYKDESIELLLAALQQKETK